MQCWLCHNTSSRMRCMPHRDIRGCQFNELQTMPRQILLRSRLCIACAVSSWLLLSEFKLQPPVLRGLLLPARLCESDAVFSQFLLSSWHPAASVVFTSILCVWAVSALRCWHLRFTSEQQPVHPMLPGHVLRRCSERAEFMLTRILLPQFQLPDPVPQRICLSSRGYQARTVFCWLLLDQQN